MDLTRPPVGRGVGRYRIAVDGAVWQVRGYGFHASAALVREGEGEHEGDGAAFGLVNFGHWPPGAGTFLFSYEDPDDPISEWIGYPYRRLGSADLEPLDRRTARTDSGLVGDARLYRFRQAPKALLALKMTDGCAVFSTAITIALAPGENPMQAVETALDQLQRALRLERRPADADAAKGED